VKEADVVQAIKELIRKTNEGGLEWRPTGDLRALTRGTNDIVDESFDCFQDGKILRLYNRKYLWYHPDSERQYWDDELVLELWDNYERRLYRFPPVGPLNVLWEAVQRKSSGVEDYVSFILAEQV